MSSRTMMIRATTPPPMYMRSPQLVAAQVRRDLHLPPGTGGNRFAAIFIRTQQP
jgi:hypothetical protein